MKKIQKYLLLFVLMLSLAFLGFSAFNLNAAEGIVTNDKILVKGASVRTSDPVGLRFVGSVEGYTAEAGKTITKYGIALAYGKQDATTEFVKDGTVGGYKVIFGESDTVETGNEFYVTLIGIPATQYDTYFTARAYVVLSDNTVVYASTVTARALSKVVLDAKKVGVEGTVIDEVYNASETVLNLNGGNIVGDYHINMKQYNSQGDKKFGNYGVISSKNHNPISNRFWNRVGINVDTQYPELYKIVSVNEKDDNVIKTYDYAIGFHDLCLDTTSRDEFYSLVNSGKALNYYVKINGTIPAENGACDLTIDFATNPETLLAKHHFGVDEKLPTVQKDYYNFDGWFNNAKLTGTKVENQTADRELFAKFTAKTYTINLELNGGTNAATCPTKYTYESAEIVLPTAADMTKEGFTFGGWYDNTGFVGEAVTKIAAKSHGNKDLYAKWIAEKPLEIASTEADKAAIEKINAENGKNPTIIVDARCTGGKVKTTFGEYTCGTNAFTSLYAAFASGKVVDSDIIYLFAGTYTEIDNIVTVNKSCVIAGPNYGIAGTETRAKEANLNSNIDIKASNVTFNGVTLSGYRRVKLFGTLSNITFTNIIDTQFGEGTNGGRVALIGMESGNKITNFVFTRNKAVIAGATGRNFIACYGEIVDLKFEDNDITNGGKELTLSECVLIKRIRGIYNFNRNNIVWSGDNYTLMFAESGNNCKTMNIIENTFAGGTVYASGLYIRYMDPNTHTNIVGNKFKNIGGNTFRFYKFPAGSFVHILYNLFDEKTSYKVSDPGQATINFEGNYYAKAQTTVTSDYGKITSEQQLNDDYANYKANQGK